jgi:two-component system sensor histidine kinase/response regulator
LFGVLLRWIKRPDRDGVAAQGRPSVKRAAVPVDAPESVPLEIAGIDTKSALKRTGGNRKRYETLLRRFAKQQAGAAEGMTAALAAGDPATAERAAHSLKGAAGTLGAAELSEAAAKAETAIKTGHLVKDALASLSRSLARVVQAIWEALPEDIDGNGAARAPADPATVAALLAQLKRLLASDDGEAAEFIVDARPSLYGALTAAEIEALSERVGNFDFDAALECLARIVDRLGLHLKST